MTIHGKRAPAAVLLGLCSLLRCASGLGTLPDGGVGNPSGSSVDAGASGNGLPVKPKDAGVSDGGDGDSLQPDAGTPAPSDQRLSRAFTRDVAAHYAAFPPRAGECSEQIHAQYRVKGPDGKWYPTWHPPIHQPSGCRFGHEHGADPATSNLFAKIGNPPFGYAAEQLAPNEPARQRKQDHVGFKVSIANDFKPTEGATTCNVMTTFHHETWSSDSVINNLHEFFYDVACSNGLEAHWKELDAMGTPGKFFERCNGASGDEIAVNAPLQPPDSPNGRASGLGPRSIADWNQCVKPQIVDAAGEDLWRYGERWLFEAFANNEAQGVQVGMHITDLPNTTGRFVKLDEPEHIMRTIDLCKLRDYDVCKGVRAMNIQWNDPRSPWTGEGRFVRPMWIFDYQNKSGKTAWYTDVFGENLSDKPFPGALEQYLSTTSIDSVWSGPEVHTEAVPNSGVHLPN
jgi:hypothetical protein